MEDLNEKHPWLLRHGRPGGGKEHSDGQGGDIYNNKVNMDFSVNINPLGIPHSVKEAMSDALSYADRYPDMACSGLKKAISEYFTQQGCSIQSEDVIPGNGASELFMAIAHALKPQKAVLLAPGFFGYEQSAVISDISCWMSRVIFLLLHGWML